MRLPAAALLAAVLVLAPARSAPVATVAAPELEEVSLSAPQLL